MANTCSLAFFSSLSSRSSPGRSSPATPAPAGPSARTACRPGDTLWSIAATSYAGDPREGVWKLRERNHLAGTTIAPGQLLRLP